MAATTETIWITVFSLPIFRRLDGEALRRGDGAQPGDQELAADDDDGDPRRHDARVVRDQDDVGRGDHQLVRERVQQHAQGGDLPAPAREVAVQAVGDGRQNEDARRQQLLPPAQQAVGRGLAGNAGDRIQISSGTVAMRLIVMELGRFMGLEVRRRAITARRVCATESGRASEKDGWLETNTGRH